MAKEMHVRGTVTLCGRCNKEVFFNEEKRSDGISWHAICYTCANPKCGRRLDSTLLTVHDNEIYCKFCYPLLFGPNGFGYGVPPAVVTEKEWYISPPASEWKVPCTAKAWIDPLNGTFKRNSYVISQRYYDPRCSATITNERYEDVCNRCKCKVWPADRIVKACSVWHKNCANCCSCGQLLDEIDAYEKDGELYCCTCCKEYRERPMKF